MNRSGPIWPKPAPWFTAAVLSGHSAVGLAFGALIYLICLTGTVSVLVDEMKLVEQRAPAGGQVQPVALQAVATAAMAGSARPASLYILAPITPRQRLSVSADAHRYIADTAGRLTPERTPFTDFVTDLHMTLTAPAPWGSLIVGLAGATLLSLILSGVLSHPRILRDAFRLRLGGSQRLREAELHNRLSVWGLPFHVTVTLTGTLFGLANLAIMVVAAVGFHGDTVRAYRPITGPEVKADARPAPLPDLGAIVGRSVAARPGSQLCYIGIERPGTRGARIAVEVSAPGRLPRGEDFYYDAAGRQIGRGRFASGALGLQAYSAAAQLHFGFFGGLPVRLTYVALGAALSFVSASGVTIWLARQDDRGRPHPRLRRAWLGWTWGVPAALLFAALASRMAAPSISFWLMTGLAQIAAQGAPLRRAQALA